MWNNRIKIQTALDSAKKEQAQLCCEITQLKREISESQRKIGNFKQEIEKGKCEHTTDSLHRFPAATVSRLHALPATFRLVEITLSQAIDKQRSLENKLTELQNRLTSVNNQVYGPVP